MGTPVADRHAFRWETEDGAAGHCTYAELWQNVNHCAAGLEAIGIHKGDRVALFMPMCPELIITFFAVIRLGAIVLPLFSGYGADAVASRLRDAEATTLVTADGFLRRGQPVRMKADRRRGRRRRPLGSASCRRSPPSDRQPETTARRLVQRRDGDAR
jgi:acetyl-CoA synthetase